MDGIKLNLGSGNEAVPEFENFDNSPSLLVSKVPLLKRLLFKAGWIAEEQWLRDWSGVRWRDLKRGLPYADNCVSKIYSSHFLEHLPPQNAKELLRECFRVLKRDGVMRVVVPDLLYHAEKYVRDTKKALNRSQLDRHAHQTFMNTVAGFYVDGGRPGREHCYMYDLPALVCLLQEIGFRSIERCHFQQGNDNELAALDSRPDESLHLEVRK
ncbi:MAG: methyltransferase domain-containing protein [Bdellovibrionales bacterium]|nr:methyltransferase domain-containing protein [Bdellovibrionales bacterium]